MHHLGDPVIAAHLLHQIAVADVAHDEVGAQQRGAVAELHGVEHDQRSALFAQHAHGVRTDVAGAAGDENGHGSIRFQGRWADTSSALMWSRAERSAVA